jgi:hypothetical protein
MITDQRDMKMTSAVVVDDQRKNKARSNSSSISLTVSGRDLDCAGDRCRCVPRLAVAMERYQQWAITNLSVNLLHDLKIHELGDGERGVYAEKNIPLNSTILTIPFSSLLTTCSAKNTPFESVLNLWREDDLLALLLLSEKYIQQEQSRWSLHILSLPVAYHNTVNFTDDELELIRGSNLYLTTRQWKEQIRSDYESIVESVHSLFPSVTGGCDWFTFESYLWALCTIWSRFVSIRCGDKVYRSMVPFFDMLNHSPSSSVGHIFLPEIDSLALVTNQTLNCEHEITLNYGELSNSKLMMLYGFCLTENPFDSIELYAAEMSRDLAEYRFKQALLLLWKIDPSQPFRIKKSKGKSDCGISRELVHCLRVQYGDWGCDDEDSEDEEEEEDDEEEGAELSGEELELVEKSVREYEEKTGCGLRQRRRKERRYRRLCLVRHGPVSLGNEMIISQLLLHSLESMASGYATTAEEDRVLLEEMNVLKSEGREEGPQLHSSPVMLYPSERVKNSVLLRYSEKLILESAREWVSQHMTDVLG